VFQTGVKQEGSTLQSTAQMRKADVNRAVIRRALGVQVIPEAGKSRQLGKEDGLFQKMWLLAQACTCI